MIIVADPTTGEIRLLKLGAALLREQQRSCPIAGSDEPIREVG
jgi:hypothetical protein